MRSDQSTAKELAGKELREMLASTEALLAALGQDGGPAVEELRERLTYTIADVRRQLGGSFVHNARETFARARDTAVSVDQFVNQRPWSAAMIATGVGVLIGLLLSGD